MKMLTALLMFLAVSKAFGLSYECKDEYGDEFLQKYPCPGIVYAPNLLNKPSATESLSAIFAREGAARSLLGKQDKIRELDERYRSYRNYLYPYQQYHQYHQYRRTREWLKDGNPWYDDKIINQ